MRIVVVGAGLAGLTAARSLSARGHDVLVLDKGRSPGGRMATRRIGGATIDHGAQFFTVRDDAFAAQVATWEADGVARVWCRGFTAEGDGFPRYVGTRGMNAITKHMAVGLDVRCGAMVFAIRRSEGRHAWDVVVDDGTVHPADAVASTCPLPQTFSLLFEAGVDLPRALVTDEYDRTLALLAVLDRPSAVPVPGGLHQPEGIFSFIGDNAAKGISAIPAVTFHAGPAWSEQHWDRDRTAVHDALTEAARPWLGAARLVESQVKRWRFATPRSPFPDPCWIAPGGSLVIAGDAFGGPRIAGPSIARPNIAGPNIAGPNIARPNIARPNIEGAYNSGLAAAEALANV